MCADAIEIVAPAGSLDGGLYALKAGADAVYFGLERFSARKAAVNLSMSDVRRLKGAAEKQGARIFAAINTVIAESERELLQQWLPELLLTGVDGIIVQDLGIASRLRRRYPDMPIHGSTQLAVHNRSGLTEAASLSFRRVVLSRELSLKEIDTLKSVVPEVEREVFVHGALCYGFSGLCLASALLTGRSGNRGECAQICRSWFEHGTEKGYFFSLGDLEAGALIPALSAAGVRAIKIEGRLKSHAYIYNTTAYYRALLENDRERAAHFLKLSALGFSRPHSTGFLTPRKAVRLTHPDYPSHVGIPGARVISTNRGGAEIRALEPLAAHDRLFRLPKGPPDSGMTVPLKDFWVKGARKRRIDKGERAVIKGVFGLDKDDVLAKTLSHDMHLKGLGREGVPEYKPALPLRVEAVGDGLRLGTEILGKEIETTYPVQVEPSSGNKPFDEVLLSKFNQSKAFPFTFDAVSAFPGHARMTNSLFVPPSALKRIRNQFYELVVRALEEPPVEEFPSGARGDFYHPLPPRERISYPDGFPFYLEGADHPVSKWPCIDDWTYLSLPPVMFEQEQTVSALTEALKRHPDRRFAVGLNNIGHLPLIERWAPLDNVFFYADYGLYTANLSTIRFLRDRIPRLLGAYLWLESSPHQKAAFRETLDSRFREHPPGLVFIDRSELFPMFISRVCFNGFAGHPACDRQCNRSFDLSLSQNKRRFSVKVRDCITYVFMTDR